MSKTKNEESNHQDQIPLDTNHPVAQNHSIEPTEDKLVDETPKSLSPVEAVEITTTVHHTAPAEEPIANSAPVTEPLAISTESKAPESVSFPEEEAPVLEAVHSLPGELVIIPEEISPIIKSIKEVDSKFSPKETFESEAETLSIEEIKSASLKHEEPGEFDWDSDGKDSSRYSAEERDKMASQYEKTLSSITKNEIITGTVVLVNSKDVVLNIGFKSDGLVPLSEFRDTPDLKIGDKVDVFVEDQEDKNGQLVLSRKRAKTQRSWDDINRALEMDTIIEGFVKSRTKGGLIVDLAGVEAFLPGSQIDIKPIRDYDIYVGKNMDFKVVKINHEFKNVVVSHKVLIEDDLENQKIDIISKLEKGQVLEGTVKNITTFGVFIDLGGVDGLLHITDLSWGRVEHPEEILKLDQKINVVVLDFDDDKKRIALGLKQLTPHPWESLNTDLQVGSKIKGKIVTVADYGAFLEVTPGVEGLIHVSEMSWSQHLRSPQEFLKPGDEVEAVVLTLDRDERKMSLGVKQLTPDPWENMASLYPIGSRHKSVVKNMTNFGVFVEIAEGVDGLIHISDLSWSKKINHPHEFTKVGEVLDVVVLDVDVENRRLSLGHKQLEENPWDTFETVFTIGSIHQGTIIKVTDKGSLIALPYGVEGFAPSKHLVKEDNTTLGLDETNNFKILEFNKEQKRILVSHSKIWEDLKLEEKAAEVEKKKKEAGATTQAVKKVKDSVEKSTLADLGILSALKSELENSEAKASKESKTKEKAS
jgi:small subunit ribosomal protein S1